MKNIKQHDFLYVMLLLVMLVGSAAADSATATGSSNVVQSSANQSDKFLDVYKSESCSCCGAWVKHMDANGFQSAIHASNDMSTIKNKYGILPEYQSCHTAVSKQGYVFEGHVPAWTIAQFLANPPKGAKGLAVPGMPVGSPGMEVGDKFTPYDVLLLKEDGKSEIYAHIATPDKSK